MKSKGEKRKEGKKTKIIDVKRRERKGKGKERNDRMEGMESGSNTKKIILLVGPLSTA